MNNRPAERELERSGISVAPPERTRSTGSIVTPKTPTTRPTSINRVQRSDNPVENQKTVSDDHDKEEEDTNGIDDEDNEDENEDENKDEDVKNENASNNTIAEKIDDGEDKDGSNDEDDDEIEEIEHQGNEIEHENDGNDAGSYSFSFFPLIFRFLTSILLFFIILSHQQHCHQLHANRWVVFLLVFYFINIQSISTGTIGPGKLNHTGETIRTTTAAVSSHSHSGDSFSFLF